MHQFIVQVLLVDDENADDCSNDDIDDLDECAVNNINT